MKRASLLVSPTSSEAYHVKSEKKNVVLDVTYDIAYERLFKIIFPEKAVIYEPLFLKLKLTIFSFLVFHKFAILCNILVTSF